MSFGFWEKETQLLLQTLIDHDPKHQNEGIMIVDRHGKILNVNRLGRTYLKLKAADLKNRYLYEFLDKESPLLQKLKNSEPVYDKEEKIFAGKYEQPYLMSLSPVFNHNHHDPAFTVVWLRQPAKMNTSRTNNGGAMAKFRFKDIVGESLEIKEAALTAEMFADSDENILLAGESGTGKELFAQAIHNNRCPNGPFIALNCAALPKELAESELFGYEGGSFTGAERSGRPGKIELADGGTLFLDEIGDMPLALQASLLRVLEDKQVMRIGGQQCKKVNFTLVAATNKNLLQMVEEKFFREDLYYRLSVLSVNIPPLRNREKDSLILSHFFINSYCWERGRKTLRLSKALEQKILEYDWPGNVRQLYNAIVFAVNKTTGDTIHIENMPSYLTSKRFGLSRIEKKEQASMLKELEKEAIEKAMLKAKHKVSLAAEILGTNRSTLYRKLQEYDIQYKIS